MRCFPDTTGRSHPEPFALGLAPGPLAAVAGSLSDQDLSFAEAVRANFRKPRTLSLPRWAWFYARDTVTYAGTPALGAGLASDLRFRLRPDGRLADTAVMIATASPELNTSLVAAVRQADSLGVFPRSKPGADGTPRQITLHLVNYDDRDGPAVGLVRLVLPLIQVETPIRIISIPRPRFPQAALLAGIASFVDLQYVVTSEGRVDPGTFRVVRAEYREFEVAAMNAILGGKFVPGTLRGCPVPMLVQQRIKFNFGQ